jgi:hypothetical protein
VLEPKASALAAGSSSSSSSLLEDEDDAGRPAAVVAAGADACPSFLFRAAAACLTVMRNGAGRGAAGDDLGDNSGDGDGDGDGDESELARADSSSLAFGGDCGSRAPLRFALASLTEDSPCSFTSVASRSFIELRGP